MDELDGIAARVVARERGEAVGPWTLEVYPTLRCNLSCAFCDTTDRHRPARGELPVERWLALVDEAAALGARRVYVLGGGEPMLAAATLPLMERAKAHGLRGMLTTNGTRLDARARERIVDMGWDEVHLSVDGADPATHDALRGQAGAFRRTVSAACALRALRGGQPTPFLALHTVLTRLNWTQIPAIVRLAHAVGAGRVDFDALVAYRPEQEALRLSPEEAGRLPEAARAGLAEAARLGVRTTLESFLAPDALARGSRPPVAGAGEGLAAAPCLKAWHHLVVQADGRTSPCCVLAGEGESLAEGDLAALWEGSPRLGAIRAGMRTGRAPGRCSECSENILVHERAIRARLSA